MTLPIFNIRAFRVGGLRFLKFGRITFMVCVSKPKPTPITGFITSPDGVLVLGYHNERTN